MARTTVKTTRTNATKRASARGTARNAAKAKTPGKASAAKPKSNSPMALGPGWRLSPDGGKTVFPATLIATRDLGDRHLAIFKSRR